MGIVVFGGPGRVTVDDRVLDAEARDVVYLGRGAKEIRLQSRDPARPAKFYFNSCAAGVAHPHRVVTREQAEAVTLGDASRANVRTIRKYIQPGVCDSALLMLGITDPAPGSIWNTMPPHIHDRRMEAYFYFDMAPDDRVMHFMGLPGETRHLVVGPEEAVFSPAWSIHMGAGTGPYCFVWGMTGENQEYNDVLPVAPKDLR
jgi:4-deoxy-L-threo-5-hexosulose-uronate ketol-isomerase